MALRVFDDRRSEPSRLFEDDKLVCWLDEVLGSMVLGSMRFGWDFRSLLLLCMVWVSSLMSLV